MCLAEVLDATIAQSATPATTLWSRDLIAPWGAWLRALTAQQPSARPSAAWISRWITGFRSNARRPARVRTAYLRTRKQTLALARQTIEVRISESVCPWLEQAVRIVRTAHALRHGSAPNHTTTSLDIQPLDAAGIKRWLVALVGVGATHWSLPSTITQRSERDLAALLERLAHRKDPSLWTLLDVLGVLHDDAIHDVAPKGQDPEDDVPLALALVQRPVSAAAMQVAEIRRGLDDPFTVQFQHHSEHAVGTGVLRPHVQQQFFTATRAALVLSDEVRLLLLLRNFPFALTASNLTYEAVADMIGYGKCFPTGEGWVRIRAWVFADVVRSGVDGLAEGERIYRYLPMSKDLVVEPTEVGESGFIDATPHRADLPAAYNRYSRASKASDKVARDAQVAIFAPLFATSFMLDDWLTSEEVFGSDVLVAVSYTHLTLPTIYSV